MFGRVSYSLHHDYVTQIYQLFWYDGRNVTDFRCAAKTINHTFREWEEMAMAIMMFVNFPAISWHRIHTDREKKRREKFIHLIVSFTWLTHIRGIRLGWMDSVLPKDVQKFSPTKLIKLILGTIRILTYTGNWFTSWSNCEGLI